MPRGARQKNVYAKYHIIVRSISEIKLFEKNKEKELYLKYMRHYQKIFGFEVYSYCLMTNHAHFIIYANGSDISKVMHGINLKFANAYNKKYKRHGHLFQDRFKSIIVGTNDYLSTLSCYIHRNPVSIRDYTNCPEKYKYSSLKVYLGLAEDETGLLDVDYIKDFFGLHTVKGRDNYLKYVYLSDDKKLKEEMELERQRTQSKNYKEVLVRDEKPEDVIDFIAKETGVDKIMLYIKNSKKSREIRALAALFMRSLCNCSCGDICKVLGNITQSRVSKLCSIGVSLVDKDGDFKGLLEKYIKERGKFEKVAT